MKKKQRLLWFCLGAIPLLLLGAAVPRHALDTITSLVGFGWFIDEDNMSSDDATKVPSQQSVKAYADTKQTILSEGAFVDGDKTKLDGIATGATANSADATLLDRDNHTGTQTLSTISDAGNAAGQDAADLPISDDTQAALDLKAGLAGGNTFTGVQEFEVTQRTPFAVESGAAVGAAFTLDADSGDYQTAVLDENATLTPANFTGGERFVRLKLIEDETGTNTVALEGTPTYYDANGNEITTLNVTTTGGASTLVAFHSDDDGVTFTVFQPSSAVNDTDAVHVDVAAEIVAVAEKTAVVANDEMLIEDSEDSNNKKSVKVTNLPVSAATTTQLNLKANLAGGNTFGARQLLAEGGFIELDAVSSADGAASGIIRSVTAGATLAFGDLIVLDATDSRWELADANSASGADGDSRGMIGICVLAAASDGDPTLVLLQGIVRADTAFPTFTVNGPIYVSETAGDVVQTSPTTEDNVVRYLGAATTTDEIYFNPAWWITYDAP